MALSMELESISISRNDPGLIAVHVHEPYARPFPRKTRKARMMAVLYGGCGCPLVEYDVEVTRETCL
jgi:hypothetical protein